MDDGAAVADSAEPNGNDASMPAEELHEESSSSAGWLVEEIVEYIILMKMAEI